jgi:hypothetical protein
VLTVTIPWKKYETATRVGWQAKFWNTECLEPRCAQLWVYRRKDHSRWWCWFVRVKLSFYYLNDHPFRVQELRDSGFRDPRDASLYGLHQLKYWRFNRR